MTPTEIENINHSRKARAIITLQKVIDEGSGNRIFTAEELYVALQAEGYEMFNRDDIAAVINDFNEVMRRAQ